MAFLEDNSFCSLEEYTRHRDRRVYGTGLEQNGLYTAMMRLQGGEKQAAKLAVRIENIALHIGLASVSFAFLDENLEAIHSGRAFVREDGIIAAFDNTNVTDPVTSKNFPIKESYLRDYFDEQFGGILEKTTCLRA